MPAKRKTRTRSLSTANKRKAASSRKRARPSPKNRRAKTKNAKRTRTVKASLRSNEPYSFYMGFPGSIPLTWIKFAIGLILLPLCWITTEATLAIFARLTLHSQFWRSQEFWFFSLGSVMWLIAFFGAKGRALLFLYVLGHECTHAISALLSGARVERLHVSSDGGHILTDKNNVFISLSPYFVPFYTVLVIAAYAVAAHFLPLAEIHNRLLFAFIGVTWTFHLTFTVWMILKNQPDLRQNGTFFSLTLIYLINLVLIVGMLIVASPALGWRSFATTWLSHAHTFGPRLVSSVREILAQL